MKSLLCLFFLLLINFSSNSLAISSIKDELIAQISLEKTKFIQGELFYITLRLENISQRELLLRNPSIIYNSLQIELFRGKKELKPARYNSVMARKNISLSPGDEKIFLLDFFEVIPIPLKPGNYTLKLKYTIDYNEYLESNTTQFSVEPFPNKEELEDYLLSLGTGINAIDMKKKFLEKYHGKKSIFENRTRINCARDILKYLKDYYDVVDIVKPIILKKDEIRKNELKYAAWYSGLAYYELGEKEKSIEMMELANTENAKIKIEEWTK